MNLLNETWVNGWAWLCGTIKILECISFLQGSQNVEVLVCTNVCLDFTGFLLPMAAPQTAVHLVLEASFWRIQWPKMRSCPIAWTCFRVLRGFLSGLVWQRLSRHTPARQGTTVPIPADTLSGSNVIARSPLPRGQAKASRAETLLLCFWVSWEANSWKCCYTD